MSQGKMVLPRRGSKAKVVEAVAEAFVDLASEEVEADFGAEAEEVPG